MSWSTCLPCLHHASSNDFLTNHQPQHHRTINANPSSDDLRRLLTDPISDSEQGLDAELLSLHSNPGRTRRVNRKKIKQQQQQPQQQDAKKITFFGFDLFGRTKSAPIHLLDEDDALYRNNNGGIREGEESPGPITPTTTTATFDSDAAPLDAATIDNLSGSGSAAAAVAQLAKAEDEERRRMEEKEERRRKRKERKELKKIAQALSVADNGGEFEGFQGSGDGYPAIPSPYRAGSEATTYQEPHVLHDSQPQPQAPPSPTALLPHLYIREDDDDEGADLDGVVYTQRRRPPRNKSNGGSDSRSRTSNSLSERFSVADYQQSPTQARSTKHKTSSSVSDTPKKRKSKSSKSTSSHTPSLIYNRRSSASNSNSGYTNTDSTSLASPTSPFFDESNPSIATVISPSTIEQGQGFFDLEDDVKPQVGLPPVVREQKSNEITARLGGGGGGFPSTGFGGGGFGQLSRSRGGAFLANNS